MKKRIFTYTALIVTSFSLLLMLSSWGMWGHQHINKSAIFALPEELRIFFYNHLDFVVEESNVPDLRKYTLSDKAENPRHYIDIEDFGSIDSLPLTSKQANAKYDAKVLQTNGILPWYILDVMEKLTKSMQGLRKTEALFLAADLGHYLADAHMPLHTSSNHNGQLTNQAGIHAFWEAQMPELYGEAYNVHTGKAHYIDDVTKETWRIIRHSHALADTLLAKERELRKTFPADKIFQKDANGKIARNKFNQPVYTREYADLYHKALNGMIENQLRGAISATANFWYTAWVNAGKPDLKSLDDEGLTKRNKSNYKKDIKAWEKGKLTVLKVEPEF
ncbi:zinc dependent phospholipase C family protein [Emticicia sp. C21]|uniref:zinc dependent phospholipase C family protein n=1 Tax=Emticicia sp. C21 TaxID=2302915 RepID=UPI000E345E31|nr:zinc dependent phospholipase C family protein [Emticicia sp. C21]RFS18354.1 S1/P1 Nuclease [Emticicia sp. C21]